MRIADSSDWRGNLPFESAVLASEVVPGEDARCVACGPDVAAKARTELWAYKHPHPKHHSGFVRFYCRSHVPAEKRVEVSASRTRVAARTPGSARTGPRRAPTGPPEVARATCPDCFVEVTSAGACSMCGNQVS